jgi:hypothetical protein
VDIEGKQEGYHGVMLCGMTSILGLLLGFHSVTKHSPQVHQRRQTSGEAECIMTDQSQGGRRGTSAVQSVDSRPSAMGMLGVAHLCCD